MCRPRREWRRRHDHIKRISRRQRLILTTNTPSSGEEIRDEEDEDRRFAATSEGGLSPGARQDNRVRDFAGHLAFEAVESFAVEFVRPEGSVPLDRSQGDAFEKWQHDLEDAVAGVLVDGYIDAVKAGFVDGDTDDDVYDVLDDELSPQRSERLHGDASDRPVFAQGDELVPPSLEQDQHLVGRG